MKFKAMGITRTGDIVGINSADSARGLALTQLFVGKGHEEWYEKNRNILLACFSSNPEKEGLVTYMGPAWSFIERPKGSVPLNYMKAPIEVAHSSLERSDSSAYRSDCPVCRKGVLLVKRDPEGHLVAEDTCLFCGQHFTYTDIEEMRKKEGR